MPRPDGSPADIKVSSQLSAISFLPLFFLPKWRDCTLYSKPGTPQGVGGAKRLDPRRVPGYHLGAISLRRFHLGVLLGLGSNPRLRQGHAAVSEIILFRLWNQIENCYRLLTARTEPSKADTAYKAPAVLAALDSEAAGIAGIALIDAARTPRYKSRNYHRWYF